MASAIANSNSILNGLASNAVFPNTSAPFFIRNVSLNPQIKPHYNPLRFNKLNHVFRASSEGFASELVEDSKFVPMNPEDPSYGPPALLLVGFNLEEANAIQQLLKDMDGEFLQVIYFTEDMFTNSLWDAVNIRQKDLGKLKIAKSVPRICFLSGLSGEEMMMFIDAFEETGLEPAIFAAHVPNSSSKTLQELIEEIEGDHEMMSGKQSDS